MSDKQTIEIECPHCKKENFIKLSSNIHCKHCHATLMQEGYQRKKLYGKFLATTMLSLAIGGCVVIDKEFIRYPIEEEYKIINSCITSNKMLQSKENYLKQSKICFCAFMLTEKHITFLEYQMNENAFLSKFSVNIDKCYREETKNITSR